MEEWRVGAAVIPPDAEGVEFRMLEGADEVLQARRLQGEVFLSCGYVEELSSGGVIEDEYVHRSRYWGAVTESGDVAGVVRQIGAAPGIDLPATTKVPLYDDKRYLLDGLDHRRVFEISALAVDKRHWSQAFAISAGLYRAMYQDFIRYRLTSHWFMIMDPGMIELLEGPFGFPLTVLGPTKWYMGGHGRALSVDLFSTFGHVWKNDPGQAGWFLAGLPRSAWEDLVPEGS